MKNVINKIRIFFTIIKHQIFKCIDLVLENKVPSYAAETSFFIILSFAPAILFMSSILKFMSFFNEGIYELINEFFPDYVAIILRNILSEILNNTDNIVPISGLVALWSAGTGIKCIINGLNNIYKVQEKRNWLVLRIQGAIYTFIFTLAIFTLGTFAFVKGKLESIFSFISYNHNTTSSHNLIELIARFVDSVSLFSVVVVILICTSLYTLLPSKKLKWKDQLRGGLFCTIMWEVFSTLLTIYVEKYGGFSLYGSLTTITVVLFWLYVSIYLFFIGALINKYWPRDLGQIIFNKIKQNINKTKQQ